MTTRRLLVLAAFLVAASGWAQESGPLVYVAAHHVKFGKSADYESFVKKNMQPSFEKMISEGTVLGWGLDAVELHHQGEPNYYLWFSLPNYAAYDKFVAAREEVYKKMAAEAEQKPAETRKGAPPAAKSPAQEYLEIVDVEKHFDWLFRGVGGTPPKPAPAGSRPYLGVARYRLQPGKESEFNKVWDKYYKPILEGLVSDGSLNAYGTLLEDWVSLTPGTRWFWMRAASGAGLDKVTAAFAEAEKKRSEEERDVLSRKFRETSVQDAWHEDFMRAVIYSVKQ